MSQSIATRTEIRGTLTCLGPVHVGGWDTTVDADLPVARDGTGRPCIPGTSLAGALRGYLAGIDRFRRRPHVDPVRSLFGHIVPRSQDGSPSWIRVDDAHLIGDAVPAVRDGVGIDRCSASAAEDFLYTRQVLPAGTRFAFRLVADTPTAAPVPDRPGGWPALIRDGVDTIVDGLVHARIPIGAGRGHGYGRVALGDVETRSADLSTPDGLIAWLTGTATPRPHPPAADTPPPADGRLQITIAWHPVSPLLVRDAMPGTVVDTLPLTDTHADGSVRLLLPGSSIRGAIRAHAERIVRTLCEQDAPPKLLDALRHPPDGVDVLFGQAPLGRRTATDSTGTDSNDKDRRGRRGVLAVADCRSSRHVDAAQWHRIRTATPDAAPSPTEEREAREQRNTERATARDTLREQLSRIQDSFPLAVSDHVAIDRWTGGAGDHRLFSVLDPATTVAWEPITIDVDVARLYRHDIPHADLALPLLLLVLRDLRDGWLSLGYGGTRGRGQVEVTDVTFTGAGLREPWQALAGQTLDRILTDPPQAVTDAMDGWAHTFAPEAR